jgi:hypothetical protein
VLVHKKTHNGKRIKTLSKSESPIWKEIKNYKGNIKYQG